MIFDFWVQANSTRIQMSVPQANLSWDIANVVAYLVFKSHEMIITMGEFEKDIDKRTLAEGHPEPWGKLKSQVHFIAPFAADTFHPEFAEQIVSFHLSEARKAMRRGILGLLDKVHLRLQIANFENVPVSKQKDFAYLLYKQLHPRSLAINDAAFDPRPYKIADVSLFLFKLCVVPFAFAIIVAWHWSTEKMDGQWWWVLALWIAGSGAALWLINQSSVLWIVTMRNFLPGHAMLKLLPELGLPRRTREKFEMMLQETESEGNCKNDN